MDAEHAAYVLAHAHDLPEDEVDRARRYVAHNSLHAPRRETLHGEEEAA